MDADVRAALATGQVIPAMPLALNADGHLDEVHERALCRYYAAAGAGGLAVGVHTTQFAIRDPGVDLLQPVLALVSEEADKEDAVRRVPLVRIAGACGDTAQACAEAAMARALGYHAVLLSLGALQEADDDSLMDHCRAVAAELPIVGFYLQPAAGGRMLSYAFWRRLAELENLIAIKIAPFNRYRTIDVVRALAASGRTDVALYTGNDDNIVADLVTPFGFVAEGRPVRVRIVGGLLGQWSVGTQAAVKLLSECHAATARSQVPTSLLQRGAELTDCNAAIFDAAHGFAGCIPGIQHVLYRQGLLASPRCLDAGATLSSGQLEEIDRVHAAYPHLYDDGFIAQHLDRWLGS